jgi:fucose 4-O-acetylase-like acetyltransferase
VVRLLTRPLRIGLAVPFFFGAGWLLNRDAQVWSDIWYTRESVFLYGFYLVGFLLRQTGLLERIGGGWSRWALLAAGSAALWFTFDLNPGSRVWAPLVLVNHSQHGDSMWFILTALAGSLAVVGLARLVPAPRSLTWVGRHSLILMGLNGFFFSFANEYLAEWMNLPPLPGTVLLWCTAVTVASPAVCVPMVWLLDRYVPQLVGRPRVHGPLLPRLVQ